MATKKLLRVLGLRIIESGKSVIKSNYFAILKKLLNTSRDEINYKLLLSKLDLTATKFYSGQSLSLYQKLQNWKPVSQQPLNRDLFSITALAARINRRRNALRSKTIINILITAPIFNLTAASNRSSRSSEKPLRRVHLRLNSATKC